MENQDFLISVREWSATDGDWFNPSGTDAVWVDQSPATDGEIWILRIAKNNQNLTLMVEQFTKYCFSLFRLSPNYKFISFFACYKKVTLMAQKKKQYQCVSGVSNWRSLQ